MLLHKGNREVCVEHMHGPPPIITVSSIKKLMEGRNKLMKASVTQHRVRPIKGPDISGLEGLGHCTA